jgi:hypothetical protein
MIPVADLNLWIESSMHGGALTLAPYVRSAADLDVQYDVQLSTRGPGGTSNVAQSGTTAMKAGEAKRLAILTTKSSPSGGCMLTVIVRKDDAILKEEHYDCAKP